MQLKKNDIMMIMEVDNWKNYQQKKANIFMSTKIIYMFDLLNFLFLLLFIFKLYELTLVF